MGEGQRRKTTCTTQAHCASAEHTSRPRPPPLPPSPQEFFIENVLDELDAPGEWFYDATAKKLYLWHNDTGVPLGGTVELTQQHVLINQTGTQNRPVYGVRWVRQCGLSPRVDSGTRPRLQWAHCGDRGRPQSALRAHAAEPSR